MKYSIMNYSFTDREMNSILFSISNSIHQISSDNKDEEDEEFRNLNEELLDSLRKIEDRFDSPYSMRIKNSLIEKDYS